MSEVEKKSSFLKNIALLLVVAACAIVIYVKFPRDTRPRVEQAPRSPPNPVAEITHGTERTPEYWRKLAELPMDEWNTDTGTFVVKFQGKDVWLGTASLEGRGRSCRRLGQRDSCFGRALHPSQALGSLIG